MDGWLGAALILAVGLGALAAAWIAEFMYRKAFPNLFRKFEKPRQTKTIAGEGDE